MASVYIQMGHCFRATGATGTGGEQELNKAVAARAARLLRNDGHTVSVRKADESVFKTDVFVAIHGDGSENASAAGASVGYQDDNGRKIAAQWKRAYQRMGWPTGFRSDNYTEALGQYYGVSRARTAGTTYAFVIECGFLTNAVDGAELRSGKGRTRAAKAIARAVERVLGEGEDGGGEAQRGTRIAASPTAKKAQAHAWADSRGCAPVFHEIIDAGWSHAKAIGIDPAVFVAQAAKETGFGRFGGVLDASFHNSCGLKTREGGDDSDPRAHKRFPSWSAGTEAHCAHLALYAGKLSAEEAGKHGDPRNFPFIAGKAKTVEKLGGAWAPSPDYGKSLLRDFLKPLIAHE